MNKLNQTIARLASKRYQTTYIVGGNIDEYALPEQLLEDAITALDYLLRHSTPDDLLTSNKRFELIKLQNSLEKLSRKIPFENNEVSNEDLILRNLDWMALRELCKNHLEHDRFDITSWENANC